jgi:hypothetical protein
VIVASYRAITSLYKIELWGDEEVEGGLREVLQKPLYIIK